MNNLMFYISFGFESLAFFAGLLLFNKLYPKSLRWLVFLLLITVINEGFSFWGIYNFLRIKNTFTFVVFFILQSLVYWLVFRSVFREWRYRILLNSLILFFIFLEIISVVFVGIEKFNPLFIDAACLHIVSIAFLYYQFYYRSNAKINFQKNPFFWLSTGMIFVNFIELFFVNATFVPSFSNSISSVLVFKSINTFGNIVYYSLIIYAFICSSRLQQQVTISSVP